MTEHGLCVNHALSDCEKLLNDQSISVPKQMTSARVKHSTLMMRMMMMMMMAMMMGKVYLKASLDGNAQTSPHFCKSLMDRV